MIDIDWNLFGTGSLITFVQAQQLAGWLGVEYNSPNYWANLQVEADRVGIDTGPLDGRPGPKTFTAELALWEEIFAPKPDPVEPDPVEPDPVEPEIPDEPDPVEPDPEIPIETEIPDLPDTPPADELEKPVKKTPPLWAILTGGIVTLGIAVASVLRSLGII